MTESEKHNRTQQISVPASEQERTLYDIVKTIREETHLPVSRLMFIGYFNETNSQKQKIDIEPQLTETVRPFLPKLCGYLLIKGLFFLHLIESQSPDTINQYMASVYQLYSRNPAVFNTLNILYNSDENPNKLFKTWFVENVYQTGPNLGETDKLDQQISDRCFQVYSAILAGAKKKLADNSVKIANECPLNIDDMMMLISKRFMDIEEYQRLYLTEVEITNDAQEVFPMRPPLLKHLEFLEMPDYTQYHN